MKNDHMDDGDERKSQMGKIIIGESKGNNDDLLLTSIIWVVGSGQKRRFSGAFLTRDAPVPVPDWVTGSPLLQNT